MGAMGATARQTQLPAGKSCKELVLKLLFKTMAEVRGCPFRDLKFLWLMVLSQCSLRLAQPTKVFG